VSLIASFSNVFDVILDLLTGSFSESFRRALSLHAAPSIGHSGMMKCDASTKSKYSAQHSDAAQHERYCVEIFHVKLRHGDVVSHFK